MLLRTLLIVATLIAPSVVLASVDVTFEATPLFVDSNVLPGDAVTRTIVIENTGSTTETVLLGVQNAFGDGLESVMGLTIDDTDSAGPYFTDSFGAFFGAAPLDLGSIAPGVSRTYTLTAALPASVGNDYQTASFGFDLLIGFAGAPLVPNTPGGSGGGSGGGGGTPLIRDEADLVLFNEALTPDPLTAGFTFTWETNRPATSYLVCAPVTPGETVSLTAEAPLFGYAFSIGEFTTLTTTHTLGETGLDPGTYECRPASREAADDAFTTGFPLQFTLPEPEVAGVATSEPYIGGDFITPRPAAARQSVLGVQKGAFGGPTYDEWRAELDAERAAAAADTADLAAADALVPDTSNTSTDRSDTGSTLNTADSTESSGYTLLWGLLALALLFGGVLWARMR